MIDLFGVTHAARRVAADSERALRGGVDLAVCAVERGQQQHATFQTLGVANRSYGNVHGRSGTGKGRQVRSDEYGSYILDPHGVRGNLHAHALQNSGQGLDGEDRLLFVAGAVQSDDHAVADQGIFTHAFDTGEIANFDLDGFDSAGQGGEEEDDHGG